MITVLAGQVRSHCHHATFYPRLNLIRRSPFVLGGLVFSCFVLLHGFCGANGTIVVIHVSRYSTDVTVLLMLLWQDMSSTRHLDNLIGMYQVVSFFGDLEVPATLRVSAPITSLYLSCPMHLCTFRAQNAESHMSIKKPG